MKKLIVINGTMGVGKSTVSKALNQSLENSAWLDGDWCWMMNPWNFSEENKEMVVNNICYILNNFLMNTSFEYIIFSWVIHTDDILKNIVDRLATNCFELYPITLMCSENELLERIKNDNRAPASFDSSVARLGLYEKMATYKINSTGMGIDEIIGQIVGFINKRPLILE